MESNLEEKSLRWSLDVDVLIAFSLFPSEAKTDGVSTSVTIGVGGLGALPIRFRHHHISFEVAGRNQLRFVQSC